MLPDSRSVTTTILLKNLFDEQDSQAWEVFDARIRPVLLAVATRMGLTDADAQDAVQECLTQVVDRSRSGGYDRGKGRLRAWIRAVLKNRVHDLNRRQRFAPVEATESVLAQTPLETQLDQAWEEESRHQVTKDALDSLRRSGRFSPDSLRAFELYVIEGKPAADVARELGMTPGAVYQASVRCKVQFKELVQQLTTAYEFLD